MKTTVFGLRNRCFCMLGLLNVGALCVLVFAAYVIYPDNHALTNIFELKKMGVFPLVTLVVSFYFPKMER